MLPEIFQIIILAILLAVAGYKCQQDFQSDVRLDIHDLAKKYGYPLENHTVQTEDGYLLTLHRIPNYNKTTKLKPPVFLMHPVLSTSIVWINSGPGKALAYLLSDLGYDVWMGNNRGNTYSRKHISFDPEKHAEQFFNYSFHEIGIYDLPASIDYVLNETDNKDLIYVGHSQGSTTFFVMASEKPDYNEKIRLMIALAPVVYLKNIPNPLFQALAKNLKLIEIIVNLLHINELMPHVDVVTDLGIQICSSGSEFQYLCPWIFGILAGFDDQIDPDFIPVIASHIPAGSSVKQLLHYSQEVNSGQFCQYDYGKSGNLIEYGSENAPLYNLSRVTTPVIIYYGTNDMFCSLEDVERLGQNLPNLVTSRIVPHENFNHLDFLWARDIVQLLYDDVIREIQLKSN